MNCNNGHTFSRAMNQPQPRRCVYCGTQEAATLKPEKEVDTEIWYQYFYFNGRDLVCGVRLYKTDEAWRASHYGMVDYVKRIAHEIEVRK